MKDEGLTPLAVRFGVDGRINEATVGRGFANQLVKDHKKHSKRRKGKGALSKQRKRLRVEKAQTISNDPIIEENVDGRRQGGMLQSLGESEYSPFHVWLLSLVAVTVDSLTTAII